MTSGTVDEPVSECPVTIPPEPGLEVSAPDDVVYTEAFPAPEPYPRRYPRDGMVWYGTEDLWTALPVDGEYDARKSAHTDEEGWFMIAGYDPDQPGCWKVEATYKDATLSYVYRRS